MKNTFLLGFALVLFSGMVTAQNFSASSVSVKHEAATTAIASPSFRWDKTSYDFGKIPRNKPVNVLYTFTNSGKAPLVIANVHVQCGCTGAEFTKEAIAPGKQGTVKLTFNAAAVGVFTKSVTVIANTTPSEISLTFNGEVIADQATDSK